MPKSWNELQYPKLTCFLGSNTEVFQMSQAYCKLEKKKHFHETILFSMLLYKILNFVFFYSEIILFNNHLSSIIIITYLSNIFNRIRKQIFKKYYINSAINFLAIYTIFIANRFQRTGNFVYIKSI